MEKNVNISYTENGYKAFICPTCKNLRYIKFSSSVILDYLDDDIIPNMEFIINCPYCGEIFNNYINEGLDALVAPIVRDLERKCYKVANAIADDENKTIIRFCEELPKEAKEFLHPDWIVNDDEYGTTISYCSEDVDERINSLETWTNTIPDRWHICPPKKFKSLM